MKRMNHMRPAGRMAAMLATFAVAAALPAQANDMKQELDLVEDFIVGVFDNYEQTYWEETANLAPQLRHRRSTAIYRKVDLPEFGVNVYYADKYWDGDRKQRSYRNLYVLFADRKSNAVRLDLLTIPRPERFDKALSDPSILRTLTRQEMISMDAACNTIWKLRGEQFAVTMAGHCVLTTLFPSKIPVHVTVDTVIGRDHFLYLSYGVDDGGKHVYGPPDLVESAELRAREFTCSVDRGAGRTQTLRLHDQGDAASIPAAGDAPAISVRLRQFTPPGSVRSEGLALLVLPNDGREKVDAQHRLTTPHAWAPRDATQIGLRNQQFGIQCQLDSASR